ncbi:MAG: hypothetical protein WDA08_05630 [Weeksellaceae bacterium]
MQDVENLFLEVGKAIDDSNISEAKELLLEILEIDPGYGRAHNHLGWIYETKLKNFDKAKRHYELAIKFCQGTYPIVYVNFAYLLIDYDRFDEAENLIDKGMQIAGADRATLTFQKGKIMEHRMKFVKAYHYYQLAGKLSFSRDFLTMLANEKERILSKMNFWEKMSVKTSLF